MYRSLAVLLLVLVAGCDSDGTDSSVGDLVVTAALDTFIIETEEDYPCANYPLLIEAETSTNAVRIEVEGIGEVEGCATALGPARAVVPLPTTSTQPVIDLEVVKDGDVDRYRYVCGVAGCDFEAAGTLTFSRLGPR